MYLFSGSQEFELYGRIISIVQVKIFLSIDILLSNNRTTKSHLCFLGNGNTMLLTKVSHPKIMG